MNDILTPMQKLHKLIPLVEINDVRLVKVSSALKASPSAISSENTVIEYDIQSKYVLHESREVLWCEVSMKVQALEKPDDGVEDDKESRKNIKMEHEATFVLTYRLSEIKNEPVIDEDTFKIFCETNAVFNSYPYFREIFHSQCLRMMVTPIVLPFLKPLNPKTINSRYSATEK